MTARPLCRHRVLLLVLIFFFMRHIFVYINLIFSLSSSTYHSPPLDIGLSYWTPFWSVKIILITPQIKPTYLYNMHLQIICRQKNGKVNIVTWMVKPFSIMIRCFTNLEISQIGLVTKEIIIIEEVDNIQHLGNSTLC